MSPDSRPCVRTEGGGGGGEGRKRQTKKQRETTKGKEKIKEIQFWVKIRTFKFSASTLGAGVDFPSFHLWTMNEMAGWLKFCFPENFKALSCFIWAAFTRIQECWEKRSRLPWDSLLLLSRDASTLNVNHSTPVSSAPVGSPRDRMNALLTKERGEKVLPGPTSPSSGS